MNTLGIIFFSAIAAICFWELGKEILGSSTKSGPLATKQDLERLETKIMSKQTEIAAGLNDLTAQLGKVRTETEALKQKITDLETALGNQDNVSPELQTAFDAVKAAVQSVDDEVPDAPAPTDSAPPA